MHVHANPVHLKNLGVIERWASILGGATLIGYSMKKGSAARGALTFLGGDLVYCGLTGYSPVFKALGIRPREESNSRWVSIPYQYGIRVDTATTIDRPVDEVYTFWRIFENLPKFMKHLHSVTEIDGIHSHWIALGPAGVTVEWDAEIINDEPGKLLSWHSLPGSEVDTAGSVHFKPAPGGRGTEVRIELQYYPPGGKVGATLARFMAGDPAKEIKEDLRRLKQVMEAGEIATTDGQPSGKQAAPLSAPARARRARRHQADHVQTASEDSFPASDAPAWSAREEKMVS